MLGHLQIEVREMKLSAKLKRLNVLYRISYGTSPMMHFVFFLPGICKFLLTISTMGGGGGGYLEYRWGYSVSWGDIMMHKGDIMSTVRRGKSFVI